MTDKPLILQVKGTKEQKRITIPKDSEIKVDDYVKVEKIKNE